MSEERLTAIPSQLPRSAEEQLAMLPTYEEMSYIMTQLFADISHFLQDNGIQFDEALSLCRVKTPERIQEKIRRRGVGDPILDLYAMRFITDIEFKYLAAAVIRDRFPTPAVFPWGKPSFRDYSIPEVRSDFATRFNPNIDDWYTALHFNILFGEGPVANIAEIQIRTPQEHALAQSKRMEYLLAQERMGQS